jgi:hypothetical protein
MEGLVLELALTQPAPASKSTAVNAAQLRRPVEYAKFNGTVILSSRPMLRACDAARELAVMVRQPKLDGRWRR